MLKKSSHAGTSHAGWAAGVATVSAGASGGAGVPVRPTSAGCALAAVERKSFGPDHAKIER
jgi:hypothetical protein